MLNPIKRVWVPKNAPAQAQTAATAPTPTAKPAPAGRSTNGRNPLFDELPSPDMEEKNSDSIWAAFDSVYTPEIERK
jgi:hypothetical protein